MKAIQLLIDCDVHCNPTPANPVDPFIPARYKTALNLNMGVRPGAGYANPFGVNRRDVAGRLPAEILENHVEKYGVTYAVIQPQSGTTHTLCHSIDMGNVLCQATNDWLVETCLETDPRFLGSICVNMNDPASAAREIRRMARHPGMVQINVAGEAPAPLWASLL